MEERCAERQALFHAVTEALDQLIGDMPESVLLQELLSTNSSLLLVEPINPADEGQELFGGELLVEVGPIRDVASAPLGAQGLFLQVDPVDPDPTAGRWKYARQHSDQSGLPGPVGPEETKDLPLFHMQIQRLERLKVAVAFLDAFNSNHDNLTCPPGGSIRASGVRNQAVP